MREYLVQFREMPASKIDARISFNILRCDGSVRNCVVDNLMNTSGSYVGLSYTETLEAEDIRTAINAARGDVFEISSMLSFGTGVAVSEPRPYVAFTNEDNHTQHQFYQCEEILDFQYSSGTAMSDSVIQMVRRFGELEADKQDRNTRDRLGSSLQILRRAQGVDDDPFTQFILLWAALEVLNDPLVRILGLGDPERCVDCGRPSESMNVRGLREYIEGSWSERREDFEDCYHVRNEILHRTKDFIGARNRAQEKLAFLRELYYGVASFLLHISPGVAPEKFIPRIACYFEHFIDFELSEPGPAVAREASGLPHLKAETHSCEVVQSGKTTKIQPRSEFTRVDFPSNITRFTVDPKVRYIGVKVDSAVRV